MRFIQQGWPPDTEELANFEKKFKLKNLELSVKDGYIFGETE